MTQKFLVISQTNLNLRSAPRVAPDTLIASLPFGSQVTKVEAAEVPWVQISTLHEGQMLTGFVHIEYLTPLTKEIMEPAPDQLEGAISADALHAIMTRLAKDKLHAYLPFLQAAMLEFDVNNPPRRAAFLAQVAHESGEFRFMEELADGAAYEGRKGLGNTQPGDGKRFKGRGPIQVTGRSNYNRYGQLLGIDLINHPELAAMPQVGFRIAGAFWKGNKLNEYADRPGNFTLISGKINGWNRDGVPNGMEDRTKYHTLAKKVLGVPASFGTGAEEEPNVDPADPRLIPLLPRGAAYEEELYQQGKL